MFLLPEARAVFQTFVPFGNPQMWLCMPSSSSVMGRTGKQLVQAVLFPKLPVNLETSCPLLIPVNTAAGELFKQHLFAPFWETWAHHKLSAKPRLDFTCSYAYNFRAGLMISGRSHARTSSLDGSDPKQGWMSQSLCWNFSSIWHWWLGPGEMLSPSHATQEKVSTSLASHNGKIPLYFNMPWAPPIKAAAFHSNPLNVTDTWPWLRAFHLQWCSWKELIREVDVEVSVL